MYECTNGVDDWSLEKKKAQISLSYTIHNIHPCLLASMPDPICVSSLEGNPKLFKDPIELKSYVSFSLMAWLIHLQTDGLLHHHYRLGVENNEFSHPLQCAITSKAKRSVSLFMTLMSNWAALRWRRDPGQSASPLSSQAKNFWLTVRAQTGKAALIHKMPDWRLVFPLSLEAKYGEAHEDKVAHGDERLSAAFFTVLNRYQILTWLTVFLPNRLMDTTSGQYCYL